MIPSECGLSIRTLLCLASLGFTVMAGSQTCRPSEGAYSCEASGNEITEAPSGTVDGQNFTFTLSSLPTSEADVHVTVNGVEVPQGVQLSVKNRSILFYPPAVPKTGDLVRAAYQTQFVSVEGKQPVFGSQIGQIANIALLKMVEKEEVSSRSGGSVTRTIPESAGRPLPKPGERAFSMLAQRLIAVPEERNLVFRRAIRDELQSLTGIEGTGDVAPATPYDALFSVDTSKRTATSRAGAYQSQTAAHFRSLGMLRNALERQRPE